MLRRDADEVRGLLRGALCARLEPAGWELLRIEYAHFRLAAFRHAIGGPFAAVCEVGCSARIPDRPPVLVTSVSAGVSYEPLRRLSPLLDLFEVGVVSDEIWPDAVEQQRDEPGSGIEIETADEIAQAADRLAAIIAEHATAYAERHASLDELRTTFAHDEAEYGQLTYAALQAASGQLEEAMQILALLSDREPSLVNRRTRRAARQLKRWIDSGRDPALIPDSSPPRPFADQPHRSFADLRAQTRAERAALNEVQAIARGKSRAQVHQMLDEALQRHGAGPPSPLWIEARLDHLWDSREDQLLNGAKGLIQLAGLGIRAAKAIRDREFPDLTPPGWLEPPDHALYATPSSRSWVAVELDPAARPYLDRVYREAPHLFGLAPLSVWIRPAPDTSTGDQIDVALGQESIGSVPARDAPAYASLLRDAAARDEHPCLQAHLALRNERCLVEIATPPDIP